MRRPFSLIGNAIASVRTLREGARNAVNALYDLAIPPDLLVHLACQAEYGTGVRAGSLDQATEQKGVTGQGALISSNPRDNFRVLGIYPVPTERFKVIFPYTVDRDREAWQWSYGMYGESTNDPLPTTGEIRKLTGKAAEMAAILVRLPLDEDFFPHLETDLLHTGTLSPTTDRWVTGHAARPTPAHLTRRLGTAPARQAEVADRRMARQAAHHHLRGRPQADATVSALMDGLREPLLRRPSALGGFELEAGVPRSRKPARRTKTPPTARPPNIKRELTGTTNACPFHVHNAT